MTEKVALNIEQTLKVRELQLNQTTNIKAVQAKQATANQRISSGEQSHCYRNVKKPANPVLIHEQFEKYKQNKPQQKESRRSCKKSVMHLTPDSTTFVKQ
jgi:hypothetical protein